MPRPVRYFLLFLPVFTGILAGQVRPRIAMPPDERVLVRIPGSVHPLVAAASEIGRAQETLPMERILLQLTSNSEQLAELEQLLADQQDPASPRYHAWLSPVEFGERFGAAQQDLGTITAWLQAQGFQVEEVAAGRRAIEFSGTVRQVEAAFHTEIHRYQWNGREHVANSTEISIPAALAPVVAGMVSLHNFGPRPMDHLISARPAPQTDLSGNLFGLSPYDFAAIYNLTPLWSAGYDGTGESIAIVGETDIKLSDIAGFRAMFGLPAIVPTVIVNGKDPGILSGEESEADLDVEWSGAVARGAGIVFVTSATTNASNGVTLSSEYIVQHASAPVLSLSYGLCEELMGSSNQFFESLWQQASAEGIAVFVASGDAGSAGCDAPYATAAGKNTTLAASQGFGINGLASSPYNVAVGGTEFNDAGSPSTYWNPTNNSQLASAKGYIPEMAWNESSYIAGSAANSLYAGGGGSSVAFPRPAWQTGPGVPAGAMRLTPDVSLSAAGHDGYLVEMEGGLYQVGGTSAAAPAFAGLMAIVNQYTHSTNGNPNAKLYSLAAQVPAIFHDVTLGSNAVPCQGGSIGCSASSPATNIGKMNGYAAGPGYDLATGLGSVDANALVTNWNGTPAAPSIVSLSPDPMTGSSAAQNLTVNGSGFVAGSSLTVAIGATSYRGSQVTFVNSSQLVVSCNPGTSTASLPVVVTDPSGQVSNAALLAVTALNTPPVITTLSPNPVSGSNATQPLTINGAGFTAGSGLKVTVGSTVYQGSQVTFVNSSQLIASVVLGSYATTLPLTVTDPNGLVSNSVTLTVSGLSVAPAISSLSPNPMTGSNAAQNLTISGSGFTAGSGLKVTVGSTVYQGSQVTLTGSSQIVVSVNVGTSAQSLQVQVTNPNGQASNSMNLTVAATIAITNLSPNPMTGANAAQNLTVNGSGFTAGSGLKVTVGSAVYQGPQISLTGSSQLVVSVNLGTTAQSLPVQVTNPNGQVSNSMTLTVAASVVGPAITNLSPNPMTGSTSAQTLTIVGNGFQPGLKITVGGIAIPASQFSWLMPTELRISLIPGVAAAVYPVQVTNSNGGASNIVNLQVNAPPAPMISRLSPDPLTGSAFPQTLTISGANFQSGAGLRVTVGGTSYTAPQVTYFSPSQLKVTVHLPAGAQTLAVQVINPSGLASSPVSLTVK